MQPLSINNVAEATQVDGIYILDLNPPGFVQGTGTSIVGVVGDFERGTPGEVITLGATSEARRRLGGYGDAPEGQENTWRGYSGYRALAGKAWPAGLRVVRAERADMEAAEASVALVTHVPAAGEDPMIQGRTLTVTARDPGNYGNRIRFVISEASDSGLTNGFRLQILFDQQAETVDNLHAAMTAMQLALAVQTAGITLVNLSIEDDVDAETDEWPAAIALEGGDDGTPTLEGWTSAIDKLLSGRKVNILFAAEPDGTTVTEAALNAYIKGAIAPASGGQAFVIAVLAGEHGDEIEDAAAAAATLRSDRIVYSWPWRKQIFPEARLVHADGLLEVPSNDVIAAALANIDPILDPASPQGGRFINAATSGLEFDDLNRDDYVMANQSGVCALEFDSDLGFRIVSGITTELTPGKEAIHRRRTADYLINSVARYLKFYQNQPITREWKDQVVGAVEGFLDGQKRGPLPRVNEYAVDTQSVNDLTTEGQGIYNILMRVRIPASARFIVLMAQVGTTVEITRRGDLE